MENSKIEWERLPHVEMPTYSWHSNEIAMRVMYGEGPDGWGVMLQMDGDSRKVPGGLTDAEAKRRAEVLVRTIREVWSE